MQDQWGLDDLGTPSNSHTTTEHIDSSRNPGNTLSHTNSVAIDDGRLESGLPPRRVLALAWMPSLGDFARTSNHKVSSDAAGMVLPLNVVCWSGVISTIKEARLDEIPSRSRRKKRGGRKRQNQLGSPLEEGISLSPQWTLRIPQ